MRSERTPAGPRGVGGRELTRMQLRPGEGAGEGSKQGNHGGQYNYGGGSHGPSPSQEVSYFRRFGLPLSCNRSTGCNAKADKFVRVNTGAC